MADFFKPEDFETTRGRSHNDAVLSAEEAAEQANIKIVQNFISNNYKDVDNKTIELYVLVDKAARIYYTGYSFETVTAYKEDNGFKDKFVVKLTGELYV